MAVGFDYEFNTDVAALQRAVREPVRRWWLKVGVWWLAVWALVVFLIWLNTKLLITWGWMNSPWSFRLLSLQYGARGVLQLASAVALPGLWLWVTAVALASLRGLFAHLAAPRLPVSRVAVYLVAGRAGWPLLVVGLLTAVYSALGRRVMEDGPFGFGPPVAGRSSYNPGESWTIQSFLNDTSGGLAGDIALALVLIALYILTGRMRYCLTFLLLIKSADVAYFIGSTFWPNGSYGYMLGGSINESVSWAGLVLAVAMLAGFARRRNWAAWGGYGLLSLGGALGMLRGWYLPLPDVTLSARLEVLISFINGCAMRLFSSKTFLLPQREYSGLFTGGHWLQVHPLSAEWLIGDAWLAFATAVLINLLWLVLLWVIIRWGVLRLATGLVPAEKAGGDARGTDN